MYSFELPLLFKYSHPLKLKKGILYYDKVPMFKLEIKATGNLSYYARVLSIDGKELLGDMYSSIHFLEFLHTKNLDYWTLKLVELILHNSNYRLYRIAFNHGFIPSLQFIYREFVITINLSEEPNIVITKGDRKKVFDNMSLTFNSGYVAHYITELLYGRVLE